MYSKFVHSVERVQCSFFHRLDSKFGPGESSTGIEYLWDDREFYKYGLLTVTRNTTTLYLLSMSLSPTGNEELKILQKYIMSLTTTLPMLNIDIKGSNSKQKRI